MKAWQVIMVGERDDLEIQVRRHYGSSPNIKGGLLELCNWTDRLYHMTKYLQSVDKEIASWDK